MRHYITIQAEVETWDDSGGGCKWWGTRLSTWAKMDHQTLAGSVGPGGQIMDRSQIDFVIREIGATAVRQGDRVQYDSRVFDVQAVANEDERGRFLRLVCMEREVG
jgi:SPP1 family predicted phage head-tail adaptor